MRMKIELNKFHASGYSSFSGDERCFAALHSCLGTSVPQADEEALSIFGCPVMAGAGEGTSYCSVRYCSLLEARTSTQ